MMMSQVQLPLHMEDCLLSSYTLSYGIRKKVLQKQKALQQIFKLTKIKENKRFYEIEGGNFASFFLIDFL